MLEFVSTTLPRIPGMSPADVLPALNTVKYFYQFARVPVDGPPPALLVPIIDVTPVDHGLIRALMRNGRASHREVARELGVADGTIRTRLRRLVAGGLLRVCAQVDPSNSGMIAARALVAISGRQLGSCGWDDQRGSGPRCLTTLTSPTEGSGMPRIPIRSIRAPYYERPQPNFGNLQEIGVAPIDPPSEESPRQSEGQRGHRLPLVDDWRAVASEPARKLPGAPPADLSHTSIA